MTQRPGTSDDSRGRGERDAAMEAASLVDGRTLADLVGALLDDLAGTDVWDVHPQLYVAAPTAYLEKLSGRDLAVDLRRDEPSLDAAAATAIATGLRAGLSVDADGQTLVTFGLAELPLTAGHPYDDLLGETLPDWAGAAILVSEGWAHPSADDGGLFASADPRFRRADGAVEARLVTAVTRLGGRVSGISVRGGDRRVWRDDDGSHGLHLGGRVPAALCRSLGVPAPAPTDRPWLLLGGIWASAVTDSWERVAAQVGPERAAAGALRVRPDVVMVTADQVRGAFAAACERRGVDPFDDDAVQALVERGMLGDDDVGVPPTVRLLAGEPPDVDALGRLSRDAARLLASTSWDDVHRTVTPFAAGVRHDEPRPELIAWLDGPSAMYHYELVTSEPQAAAALRQVAALPRTPRWFRDTVRTFRDAAERTRLPTPEVDYFDEAG